MSVPAWIKRRHEYRVACLKGLFETDGSIYSDRGYPMAMFASASVDLAWDVSGHDERSGLPTPPLRDPKEQAPSGLSRSIVAGHGGVRRHGQSLQVLRRLSLPPPSELTIPVGATPCRFESDLRQEAATTRRVGFSTRQRSCDGATRRPPAGVPPPHTAGAGVPSRRAAMPWARRRSTHFRDGARGIAWCMDCT